MRKHQATALLIPTAALILFFQNCASSVNFSAAKDLGTKADPLGSVASPVATTVPAAPPVRNPCVNRA